MSAMQMPCEAQARIRALPGNKVCVDCNNKNPQWASVSYGCLMCLECSGVHRSIGVHLSFVRSVAMDSWTDEQIRAMELSGGNESVIQYFKSKGIDKSMKIQDKYNTAQAESYRRRLAAIVEGTEEPSAEPTSVDGETTKNGSGVRSSSCSTEASSGRSESPGKPTAGGKGQFAFDDFDDWFEEACAAPPQRVPSSLDAAPPNPPLQPTRHQSAPAVVPAQQKAQPPAKPAPKTADEKEILAIKNMSLRADPVKPKPRAEMPVGDDFFASFGVN